MNHFLTFWPGPYSVTPTAPVGGGTQLFEVAHYDQYTKLTEMTDVSKIFKFEDLTQMCLLKHYHLMILLKYAPSI